MIFNSFGSYAILRASDYTLYTGLQNPVVSLIIDNQGLQEDLPSLQELVYEPDVPLIGVIGGSYGYLSFSYSHNITGPSSEQLDFTDYSFDLYFSWIGIDASYTEFERFKLVESLGFASASENSGPDGARLRPEDVFGDEHKGRPDIAARFMTANLYLFPISWGYDFGAAFEPDEEKSTGFGLGMVGSYAQSDIDTDNGLVPDGWKQSFSEDGQFLSGSLSSINIQLAAGLTLAAASFYISSLIALGPGQQSSHYETQTETREVEGMAQKDNIKLSFGYAGKSGFLSFNYISETPTYILRHMSISMERSDLYAIVGIKF